MKSNAILGILLIGSLTLNVFYYFESKEEHDGSGVDKCVSTPGYEVASTLSNEELRSLTDQYKSSLPTGKETWGGIVTRTAIDEIFCPDSVNALVFYLAKDSTCRFGPADTGTFVIFTGGFAESDGTGNYRVIDKGIKNYYPRQWCPPSCLTR
jgi:hypothetical protein